MSFGVTSWVRLTFVSFTNELKVDGDLFAVLGLNTDKLINSTDPLTMLPDLVVQSLTDGKDIIRDEKSSLVIIPGKSDSNNTVTIIFEQSGDFDLVADMAGGVVGFSPDGKILKWNQRMTYLFGSRAKDVKGRSASDVLPSPILYDWESVISSAHLGHEVRIEFKPVGERRVEGILSRGGPGVVGLFRDSTENYKTGKRLRALNRLNQAYLQSTGTGMLLLDSRLRILLSNPGFAKITGHKGSLIGHQLHDVLAEDAYKWVHDASEHLFAENRTEQSGVLAFLNQDGKQITLRQTLRAVRNETNQTLNFVCLFEDETELAFLHREVDYLNTGFAGISKLSKNILLASLEDTNSICEEILRITRSTAVAQYLYDPFETIRLAGRAGAWPKNFPVKELSEFEFPAFVWSGAKQYKISSSEMGKLTDHFKSCTVLSIGTGIFNHGYFLLMESALSDLNIDLLNTVSSLLEMQSKINSERSARSAAEKDIELSEGVADTLLDHIPLPLAVIRMDGRVDHWNHAMERVCGVKAEDVDSNDITRLIDPEKSGLTLDSYASGMSIHGHSSLTEWAVKRKDDSMSAVYRWKASVLESSSGFSRYPVFLIVGIHLTNHPSSAASLDLKELPGNVFLKKVIDLLSASSSTDLLHAISHVCFMVDGGGAMEFLCNGKSVASFSLVPDESRNLPWSLHVTRDILEREYEIRATHEISRETVDTVVNLLSYRNMSGMEIYNPLEVVNGEVQRYMTGLIEYLKLFFTDAIQKNHDVLHLLGSGDPFAGFARTMLYSHETAVRVFHLIGLSIQISVEDFTEESLEFLLPRLQSYFKARELSLPSLSLGDKMLPVSIIPDVLLHCFVTLCELAVPEGVILFKARNAANHEDPGVILTVIGLNEVLQRQSHNDILKNIESNTFSTETAAAIVLRILKAAGCSLTDSDDGKLTFFLRSAE